jgi:hypothetical protein
MDCEEGFIKAVDIYKQYGDVDVSDLDDIVKIKIEENQ